MFQGIYTALITPFTQSGEVDLKALERLIDFQIKNGVDGLVVMGTTAENPTLLQEERENLIRHALAYICGRVKVIVGTGSNATAEAVKQTAFAKSCGADAVLVVAPYYNKPTQEGLYAHYKTIVEAVDIPLMVYNVPGRTVTDIRHDTVVRLSKLPHIFGIKDATGDMARPLLLRQTLGEGFVQFSGDDISFSGFLAQGGHGIISVASNIIPHVMVGIYKAWKNADVTGMMHFVDQASLWGDALFWETNPTPVKYIASLMGLCTSVVRAPLVSVSPSVASKLDVLYHNALKEGIIIPYHS